MERKEAFKTFSPALILQTTTVPIPVRPGGPATREHEATLVVKRFRVGPALTFDFEVTPVPNAQPVPSPVTILSVRKVDSETNEIDIVIRGEGEPIVPGSYDLRAKTSNQQPIHVENGLTTVLEDD